ncbi:hypothetical protein [Rhizobium sp.]
MPHVCFKRSAVAACCSVIVGGLASCSSGAGPLTVSAADYGDRWPYQGFDGGILNCYPKDNPLSGKNDLQEITITLGGTEYGINGTALVRFPDPHQFVPRSEFDTYEAKALDGMDELMSKGRALCKN